MAMVYEAQGEYGKALELYEQALAIKLKALGPAHARTADTMYNMALLHRKQGNGAQAKALFLRCAATYAKCYGEQHEETRDARRQAGLQVESADVDDVSVAQLLSFGFARDAAVAALQASGGDVEAAANTLLV